MTGKGMNASRTGWGRPPSHRGLALLLLMAGLVCCEGEGCTDNGGAETAAPPDTVETGENQDTDSDTDAPVVDADQDGYPEGEDCDDGDASVFPGAEEICNGVDDDCDGDTDEADAQDAPTWYRDGDGDSYGDSDVSEVACDAPDGHVENDLDCDDDDEAIHPDAEEFCDGVDNDCDGDIDEDVVDMPTWFRDADSDGYGDQGNSTEACEQPLGFVADPSDCDDGDPAVNPEADEVCDGYDNDCDGDVDDNDVDAIDTVYCYWDMDADGYGGATPHGPFCENSLPSACVFDGTDCDDADGSVNPGQVEVCGDGVDNDCDRSIDEGC